MARQARLGSRAHDTRTYHNSTGQRSPCELNNDFHTQHLDFWIIVLISGNFHPSLAFYSGCLCIEQALAITLGDA